MMLRSIAVAFAVVCVAVRAMAVTIDTVPVGNAGNAADGTGFGALGRMGSFEPSQVMVVPAVTAMAIGRFVPASASR